MSEDQKWRVTKDFKGKDASNFKFVSFLSSVATKNQQEISVQMHSN
jgi:hypothetical protein